MESGRDDVKVEFGSTFLALMTLLPRESFNGNIGRSRRGRVCDPAFVLIEHMTVTSQSNTSKFVAVWWDRFGWDLVETNGNTFYGAATAVEPHWYSRVSALAPPLMTIWKPGFIVDTLWQVPKALAFNLGKRVNVQSYKQLVFQSVSDLLYRVSATCAVIENNTAILIHP